MRRRLRRIKSWKGKDETARRSFRQELTPPAQTKNSFGKGGRDFLPTPAKKAATPANLRAASQQIRTQTSAG